MYFVIAVWFGFEIIFNSTVEYIFVWKKSDVNKFMAVFVLVLIIIQILFLQSYRLAEIFVLLLLSIPVLIGTIRSGDNMMMSTWLFVIASKHIDFDKIIQISFVVLVLGIGIVFYLYYTGWIEETYIYRGSQLRHSMGFIHPNWLGVRCFQLIIAWCYIRRKRIGVMDYALIVISAYFVYKVPNCKTAYYSLAILLILLMGYHISGFVESGKQFFLSIIIMLSIISNAGSIFLSYINLSKYQFLKIIDRMMSHRFSACHRTWMYYGTTLLGQNIDLYIRKMNVLVRRFYLDTAYVAIFLKYGVIVYGLFSILYIKAMSRYKKSNNGIMVIILGMYAIYGIMEKSFFSMTQNIFLLALANAIYDKNVLKEDFDFANVNAKFRISV